jgi:hypothetical protein
VRVFGSRVRCILRNLTFSNAVEQGRVGDSGRSCGPSDGRGTLAADRLYSKVKNLNCPPRRDS